MVRVALAQINTVVGDIDGNTTRILEAVGRAEAARAHVVAVPELAITGYPPEDLVLKRPFVEENRAALDAIAAGTGATVAVVGFVQAEGGHLYNAAAICQHGTIAGIYRKHQLPNYGVFDEERYFEPGTDHILLETGVGVIGVCVCEDAWLPDGPLVAQGDAGAQVVVNLNASPFHKNKQREREAMLADRSRRSNAGTVYVNAVGGQDELVFDGGSLVLAPDGSVVARLPQFEEAFAIVDVPLGETRETHSPNVKRLPIEMVAGEGESETVVTAPLEPAEEIYRALCLGLRDYAAKNGFGKVVLGLSGGIDSTLTATIAADALGPDAVLGVAMPSEFSSSHSIQDAKALATNLDIEMLEIPIAPVFHSYLNALEGAFGSRAMGLAEENLQARVRGNILMAISNRDGHLVLATGNKSEMACGYATLYGDMAGGLAVLKDVFKTEVYELARYRNTISPVIPDNVLTKPPSAELRPDQKDTDSLPPYDELDPILVGYIEEDLGTKEIAARGHDRPTVERIVALVDRSEYKRRQAPPGIKVTTKAFGRDRRLPITNRWREDRDMGQH